MRGTSDPTGAILCQWTLASTETFSTRQRQLTGSAIFQGKCQYPFPVNWTILYSVMILNAIPVLQKSQRSQM